MSEKMVSAINMKGPDESHFIRCQAVNGPEDYRPFNFLDYFDEAEANEALLDCAHYAESVARR
jgi:hypothetical protein